MGVAGYQVGAVYNIDSYAGPSGLGRTALWMAGASLAAPTGSNLPAPAPVGRYGSFVGAAADNNFMGTALSTESKQLPMRIGPRVVFVAFTSLSRHGIGSLTPAYGN